jgi:CheY-like chemotaxis protein
LILKANNYNPILAKDGKEALDALSNLEIPPDIIISDIMMPEMNGYEFFKVITNNPNWNQIPFIFLSARSSQKDIRLGKLLGVDDYLTKPFKERDLLAVISGKLSRIKRVKALNKEVDQAFSDLKLNSESLENTQNNHICLLIAFWDDKKGPELRDFYPEEKNLPIPLNEITVQLFSAATSIYGHDKISKAEGVLLNIKNLGMYGYLYFDSYPKKDERYGEKQIMLAILAPIINYFHSLKIKEILINISKLVKQSNDWDKKSYLNQIKRIIYEEELLID